MQTLSDQVEAFTQAAKQGILCHAVPPGLGGFGDNFADLSLAYEKLGKESLDTGLILSLQAHIWGVVFPLIHFGTAAQQKVYFPKLLDGSLIGGHAITEPLVGSDISSMQSTYNHVSGGYQLSGHKRYITNTPIADLLIIYARKDTFISAFIVEKGPHFLDCPKVEGFSAAPMGDVILEDHFVPKDNLLGEEGSGAFLIQSALELERAFLFSGIAGVMEWQLKTVTKYVRKRKVGTSSLGSKQAISHTLAEMATRLETVKLWIKHCAFLKDSKKRITVASAQTKLFASEAFLQSSLDAVHVMGALGLNKEQKIVQLTSDALAGRLLSGTSEVQKNIIAGFLGLGE
jgi:alkylation response protein AidB-like acyl-CoA dehydrogenase